MLRVHVDHEVLVWTVRKETGGECEGWSGRAGEISRDARAQHFFIARAAAPVHRVGVNYLSQVVPSPDLEPWDACHRNAVEGALVDAHVEHGEARWGKE